MAAPIKGNQSYYCTSQKVGCNYTPSASRIGIDAETRKMKWCPLSESTRLSADTKLDVEKRGGLALLLAQHNPNEMDKARKEQSFQR